MESEWQSWAAPVVVVITMIGFAWQIWRKQKSSEKSSSCGGGCGCNKKWQEKDFLNRR